MQNKVFIELYNMFDKIKNGILQMFSANILNKVIVMISNMIITRILTKPEYGLWSYVLNIYSYASLITGLGLSSGAFQFATENRGSEKEYSYFKYCLSTGLIINSIISVVFIFSTFLGKYSIENSDIYIRAYVPILLLEYINEILTSVLRCENRIKKYAKALNINTILVTSFTCVGAFWGITGVIIGKYVATSFSISYNVILTEKQVKSIKYSNSIIKSEIKEVWYYSIFTGISSALNRMLYLIDVSMIAAMIKNTVDIAIYKVATLIPNSLSFIPSSVIVVILPDIIAHNQDSNWLRQNVKKSYIGLLLLNMLVGIISIIFAPLILGIISGPQYKASVYPFRILIIGYIVSGTFRDLSSNILAGLRKVGFNLFISIFTGIADIILNYVLIYKYSMIGAAYATMFVDIIASVLSFGFLYYLIYSKRGSHS